MAACTLVNHCTKYGKNMVFTLGVVPVVIKPPAPSNLQGSLPAMKLTIELSDARAILTTHYLLKLLKSKV